MREQKFAALTAWSVSRRKALPTCQAGRGIEKWTFRWPEHCDPRECLIDPGQAIPGGVPAAARRALGMLLRAGEVGDGVKSVR